jgi:hypothetical protein
MGDSWCSLLKAKDHRDLETMDGGTETAEGGYRDEGRNTCRESLLVVNRIGLGLGTAAAGTGPTVNSLERSRESAALGTDQTLPYCLATTLDFNIALPRELFRTTSLFSFG